MKRCFTLVLLALSLMLLTTACGTEQEAFQLVVCGPYLDEAAVTEYGDTLVSEDSSWGGGAESFPLRCGSEHGQRKAGPHDLFHLCDEADSYERRRRYRSVDLRFGKRGFLWPQRRFCDLSQLCTEEELAPYTQHLITFQLTDEEGNLLEEETPPCGIELTSMEQFSDIYGDKPCGVFISSTSFHTETAKEALLSIAAGEAL